MLAAVPVSADQPIEVSGTWDYCLTSEPKVKVAGPNVFIFAHDHGDWTGTFVGGTEEELVVVCYAKAGFNFYKGAMTFTGTVEDGSGALHDGTMFLKNNGKQYANTCDPSPAEWKGHWVIIGGTGGLANPHGQWTFHGPRLALLYEGQIHFDESASCVLAQCPGCLLCKPDAGPADRLDTACLRTPRHFPWRYERFQWPGRPHPNRRHLASHFRDRHWHRSLWPD